jgi:hypothetical protein
MPDWEPIVRDRLASRRRSAPLEEEIVQELAHHLEDVSEDWILLGFHEQESAQQALAEVSNWKRLARRIRRAREGDTLMKDRVKSLWLPGMVMTIVAMSSLNALMRSGFQPSIVWLTHGVSIQFYVPWLMLLPVIGALAAYWSGMEGGSVRTRVTAALFSALTMAAIFFFAMPLAALIDQLSWSTISTAVVASVVGWVIVPGAALLIGALPFISHARLARELQHTRDGGEMLRQRMQTLWIPGLVAAILSTAAAIAVNRTASTLFAGPHAATFVYGGWLLILTGIGAFAAHWSRRAGGSVANRTAAALFPAITILAALGALVTNPELKTVVIASVFSPNGLPIPRILPAIVNSVLGGILLPAVACLAGALPFLRQKSVVSNLRAGTA